MGVLYPFPGFTSVVWGLRTDTGAPDTSIVPRVGKQILIEKRGFVMKMLNKVLAAILSLVMLLTVVPVSAFAAGSAAQTGSPENAGSSGGGMTVTVQAPNPTGVGADGTVTFRLNAQDLVSVLRSDGDLTAALVQLLKGMIERSDADIVTVTDIMELIPVNNIISLLLGESNENVSDLIEQFGGIDAVSQMLNMEELVLTAKRDELVDFITSLNDLASFIRTDAVFGLDIDFKLDQAYQYVDRAALEDRLEQLTYSELLALVGGDSAKLKQIVDYDDLMEELLERDLVDPRDAVDLDELKNNTVIRDAIMDAIRNDYESILTPAGIAKLQQKFVSSVDMGSVSEASFKSGALLELAKSVAGDNLITYLESDVMLATVAVRNIILDAVEAKSDAEKQELLTEEAKAEYLADPDHFVLEWDDIEDDAAQELLEALVRDEDSGMQNHLSEYFKQADFLNTYRTQLTAKVRADAEAYIKGNAAATVYLKKTVVDGIVSDVKAALDENFFTDADYDETALTDLVLDVADSKNVDLMSYLKDGYNPFDIAGVSAVVMDYINWDNVNDDSIVNRRVLLETVLGADGNISDLISPENLSAYLALIITPVFDKMNAGEVTMNQIVDVQALIATIPASDYPTLIGLFDRDVLVKQLMPQAKNLVGKLTQEQIKNIVVPVLSSLVQNVDLISLDGYEIAKEQTDGDTAGLLALNFREAAAALASLIPTLGELSETDGTLISFNFYAKYKTVGGADRTKDININVVLEGDLTALKRVAGKLAQYITVTRDGNQLSVELTVPAVITEAYKKLLNSDRGTELKKELLALADKEGAELVDVLEKLTLEQILSLLSRVDVEALYSYIMNLSAVEAALEKIKDVTGLDYSIEALQDLNNVLDAIANGVPSLQAVCDALQARIHIDVMAALEKVADTGDRNQTVQAMLDKLCQMPKIGSYISAILDEHSLTEILENYKNVEPVEAVSNYIAARIGVNLQEIIATHDANEIWQNAIERAEAYESYFNRVKNFALNMLDPDFVPQTTVQQLAKSLIPESLLRKLLAASLTDAYYGNGAFSVSADSISVDLAHWSRKALDLLAGKISLDDSLVAMLEGFLPQSKLSFGVGLTVRFQELSQVTYLDENGDKLLTAYLANGVNPSVAITAPVVEGKEFLYWADASGKRVDQIDGDVVLKAVYNLQTFVVSFTDVNGNLLQKYTVNKGNTVPEIPEVPTAESLGLYNGKYILRWYLNGVEVTPEEILSAPVVADVTYVYEYTLEPEDRFFDVSGQNITVSRDADGNWTVTVDGDYFVLTINRANGALEEMNSLTVIARGVTMALDRAMIGQLIDDSNANSIICISSDFGKDKHVSLANEHFEYKTKDVYMFDLLIDGVAYKQNFTGDFRITLPYANALSGTDMERTAVYVVGENSEFVAIQTVPGVSVTFSAPHFSDYVIVNEYKVSAEFTDGTSAMNGTLNVGGMFIPAGAKIFSVRPVLSEASAYGKVIQKISYVDETGSKVELNKIGDSMTMPACAVTVTSLVGNQSFRTYYKLGDQIFTDRAEAETYLAAHAELIPLGYRLALAENQVVWVGNNATTVEADVYLTPKLECIEYTLSFEGVAQTVTFTVENYSSAFAIPAVPTRAGYTGEWILSTTDPIALIQNMTQNGVTSKSVQAKYTERSYQVFFPDSVQNVKYGASVAIQITAKPGYTVQSVKAIQMNDGAEIAITDGSFTMPASNVRIEVTEVANTIHFTVLNRTNGEKQELTALFGTYASFTIQVPAGSVLESAPAIGKLVSFTVNQNGSKTVTFSFLVTEEIADNTEISYALAVKVPTTVRLANGLVTDDDAPVSSVKSLTFAGFAAPSSAKFETVHYEFAEYTVSDSSGSLLWLWILIAVVVLIGLIALFYNLYIRGKLKPNFFLRFIVFLVTVFFNICLGVSAVVLAIAQGTKKKEKIDFNAFGMANPEPEDGAAEAVVMTPTEAVEADLAVENEADAEPEAEEAEATEAETENEVTDGEAADGENADSEVADGEAVDVEGEATEVEAAQSETTEVEATEVEAAEGDASVAEQVAEPVSEDASSDADTVAEEPAKEASETDASDGNADAPSEGDSEDEDSTKSE